MGFYGSNKNVAFSIRLSKYGLYNYLIVTCNQSSWVLAKKRAFYKP
jgi:hypothetical protein